VDTTQTSLEETAQQVEVWIRKNQVR